jgi:hypothetical protein
MDERGVRPVSPALEYEIHPMPLGSLPVRFGGKVSVAVPRMTWNHGRNLDIP